MTIKLFKQFSKKSDIFLSAFNTFTKMIAKITCLIIRSPMFPQRSACGDEESPGSEEAAESTANTYQESTRTLLPIQDTSENGFPALPSQQGIHCADSMVKCAGGQNDGRADSNEEEKENLDEDDALAEDTLRGTYKSMSPLSVGVKAQGIPYVSPYVLDVMDALPPASVSPDGRAMVEWRRSLLPHVPKHTLPVFHNKYKAKVGRSPSLIVSSFYVFHVLTDTFSSSCSGCLF